ncbi:MAG: hypothetical protein K0Q74_1259 [Gammaproteobacteria bacterium]|jgi:hypothetical protein|nr:hypothetical protein [Gammaproteobacteria bacterium]
MPSPYKRNRKTSGENENMPFLPPSPGKVERFFTYLITPKKPISLSDFFTGFMATQQETPLVLTSQFEDEWISPSSNNNDAGPKKLTEGTRTPLFKTTIGLAGVAILLLVSGSAPFVAVGAVLAYRSEIIDIMHGCASRIRQLFNSEIAFSTPEPQQPTFSATSQTPIVSNYSSSSLSTQPEQNYAPRSR